MSATVKQRLKNVVLLEPGPSPSITQAQEALGADQFTIADFNPKGEAKTWQTKPWGFSVDSVNIVDHHANDPRFFGPISSAPLALHLVAEKGIQDCVVINHVDCDSVLSSGILSGILPTNPELAHCAVIADHYGQENPIADLLQALEPAKDLEFSFASLEALMSGSALPSQAQALLARRQNQRELARKLIATSRRDIGRLATFKTDEKIESELIAAEVTGAWVVAIEFPHSDNPDKSEIKLRLTPDAPAGLTLFDLGAQSLIPNFGGRWNAGSSGRSGGMDEAAEPILEELARRISAWLAD